MIAWWWSVLLGAVGITGLWLAGNMRAAGWAVGVGVQVLWATYGTVTGQWGFIVTSVVYGAVNSRNLWRWHRDRPRPDTGGRHSRRDPTDQELADLMPPPALGAAVLARVLAVFPEDPDEPSSRHAVTGYTLICDDDGDQLGPERYWAPAIGDALPLARAVTAAALLAVADVEYATTHPDALVPPRDQLRRMAYQIQTGEADPERNPT